MPGRNSQAIKDSGTTRPEFFGLQRGRPNVEIKNCGKRFFLPTMGFRTILRGWRLLGLHLDDFDSFFAESFGEFWSSPLVGDQALNAIEGTYPRDTSPSQFREIGNDIYFLR